MNNFQSSPTQDGNSWSITTGVLIYLKEAEINYGLKTNDFIYGGVELTTKSHPGVWYQFGTHIIIQVTDKTITNLSAAIL